MKFIKIHEKSIKMCGNWKCWWKTCKINKDWKNIENHKKLNNQIFLNFIKIHEKIYKMSGNWHFNEKHEKMSGNWKNVGKNHEKVQISKNYEIY